MASGALGSCSHCIHSQEAERNMLTLHSLFCLLRTPMYEVESPTVGIGLPTSANPI